MASKRKVKYVGNEGTWLSPRPNPALRATGTGQSERRQVKGTVKLWGYSLEGVGFRAVQKKTPEKKQSV